MCFFVFSFFFFFVETKWLNYTEKSRPSILSLALENFEWRELFLKLICLTSNLLHVPVTSSECKRCFSMMKRLRTGLWTSFLTKQLTALAIMNIHKNHHVSSTKNCTKRIILHPGKINFNNQLFFSMEN